MADTDNRNEKLPLLKKATPSYGTEASSNHLRLGRASSSSSSSHPPQQQQRQDCAYLQTYTPGEDPTRLAAAARELGLQHRRNQRRQIRSVAGLARNFHETFGRIVFEQKEAEREHDVWETVAGVAGNVLEWYDFAGKIIGRVFFPPNQSGNATTLESFMVFGGAFLMRPVGGLLLGYLGDVYGRRRALYVSIFLMAWPTFLMGCLPSFERVGYLAPFMLVIIRALQGMSVGGQLMSSLVFTLENVPKDRWGLYGSFVWATGNFGVLLGGLVGYAIRANLSDDQLLSFGWRLPFLSGVVVSFAGFYLRSAEEEAGVNNSDAQEKKDDSLHYNRDATKEEREAPPRTNPFGMMFQPANIRPLLSASMVPMIWSAGFYLSFVWMAIYMSSLTDKPVRQAFLINSASLFIGVCVLFPIAGWMSDKFGRRLIMSIGGTSLAILGPTFLRFIGDGEHPGMAFASQLLLGVCLSFWGSPMGAWLTESFEPEARLTSVSFGYNCAHAIVGGSTPALATYLVDAVGPTAPGWIYVYVASVSMTGLWCVAPPRPSHPSFGS